MLAAVGLILFHLAWLVQGDDTHFWLPGLGIGIALVSWLGWRILPLLTLDLLFLRWLTHENSGGMFLVADTLLHATFIGSSWWLYHQVARGSRWLDDPRSATIFLILVPGGLSALTAAIQASYWADPATFWILTAELWLSRMVGILVVAPLLIITCTPILQSYRLVDIELPPAFFGERERSASRMGDRIELAGLTFASSMLAVLLLWAHLQGSDAKWMLWASCLVLIVWTCIRQDLFGGCFSASITSISVLTAALKLEQEGRLRKPGKCLEQALGRFNYIVGQRFGITKKNMGVTSHGLRHSFAEMPYTLVTGTNTPVSGGDPKDVDRQTHVEASFASAKALGHSRVDVTRSYYGSHGHKMRASPATPQDLQYVPATVTIRGREYRLTPLADDAGNPIQESG